MNTRHNDGDVRRLDSLWSANEIDEDLLSQDLLRAFDDEHDEGASIDIEDEVSDFDDCSEEDVQSEDESELDSHDFEYFQDAGIEAKPGPVEEDGKDRQAPSRTRTDE